MRGSRFGEAAAVVAMPLAAGGLIAASASFVGPGLAPGAIAAGLVAVAAVAAAVGHPRLSRGNRRRARLKQLAVVIASLSLLGAVSWYAEPRPLTRLAPDSLHTAFVEDARLLDAHRRGLEAVVDRLDRLGLPPAGDALVLSASEERALLESWREIGGYTIALEGLRRFYEDYYRLDLAARRLDHVTAFLLTFAADAAIYDAAARFAKRVSANPNAVKFLDAPHEDMPAGSFSRFHNEVLGTKDSVRISAGRRYLALLPPDAEGPLSELRGDLRRALAHHLARIRELGHFERAELASSSELEPVERAVHQIWFPVQKGVAEVLGDTRVRRIGSYLVDSSLRERLDGQLEPGDILLARKNWYLSNVGLPGFWPHAILYLGTPDKLRAHFDRPEVRALAKKELGEDDLAAGLARRFPEAWDHYLGSDHGEPRRVIEAVSEGVVFSSLAACAGDYVAALRPRLDDEAKARAIIHAFAQFEKPYDFDFDFATDHALVCTELVWRAYRPAEDKAGLHLDLVSMAGRMTLPANDIARQYAARFGTPEQELDFVAFIDASEAERRAFLSTEEAFRASAARLKWDIAQD